MKTLIKQKRHTQAAKVVSLSDRQVAEIRTMFDWTAQQYYEHQYEQYEAFLKRALFGAPIEVYNAVRYSPMMRGLWVNEWVQRNEVEFLPFARDNFFAGVVELEDGKLALYLPESVTVESVIDEYCFVHNCKRLYNDQSFMIKYFHILELIHHEKYNRIH